MNPEQTRACVLKILLVDDDPAEHILLKRTLEKVGRGPPPIDLVYVGDFGSASSASRKAESMSFFLDNRLGPNNDFPR